MGEGVTDRDHFAAAALAGLLAQGDDGSFSEESYAVAAYRWADAMLRERGNHSEKPNSSTNHDAAPAATADAERSRTDKAVIRPGEGAGDTPTLTDAEREAVAWAARLAQSQRDSRDMAGDYAASMRGLLERMGAANSGEDRRSGCGE